jgi:hypothetical protein
MKKIRLHIAALLSLFLYAAGAQAQQSYSLFQQADMATNPALTGMAYNDFWLSHLYQSRQGHDGQVYRTNYTALQGNSRTEGLKLDSGKYLWQTGYLGLGFFNERQRPKDQYQNYSSNCLSVSYNIRFKNKYLAGIGIQPMLIDYHKSQVLDYSIGGALMSNALQELSLDEYRKRLPADNYIGMAIYHVRNAFDPKADSTGIPSKRIQFSSQFHWVVNRDFDLVPAVNYIYNGRSFLNAGMQIEFRVKHAFYNRVRLGLQYQTSSHIAYTAGMRILKLADVYAAYNGGLPGIATGNTYQKGFEIGINLIIPHFWGNSECY